jgi:predicted transcriptional regulator
MEKTKAISHSGSRFTADIIREASPQEVSLIDEIEQALKEADSGDFVSPDEVKAVVNRWVTNIS